MSHIQILDEDRLSLGEARSVLGTNGKPCDFATVYRAVMRGHLLPSGERLRLEAIRVGGEWQTSRQAIARYVEAMTAGWLDPGSGAPLVMPSKASARRRREIERAQSEAAAIGI